MIKFNILDMHCNETRFKLNLIKAEPNTKFEINPMFHIEAKKIKELPKRRIIETTVEIKSTEKNPQPLDIYVDLVTAIDLEEEIWLVEDEEEFMRDATRHIYPYIRSIISSITTAAMVRPFTLPPFDGAELFKQTKKNQQ